LIKQALSGFWEAFCKGFSESPPQSMLAWFCNPCRIIAFESNAALASRPYGSEENP
jgi:hypothetical protein